MSQYNSVNSSEKLPTSATPKVSRVGNLMLTLPSASLKFPRTCVRSHTVPFFYLHNFITTVTFVQLLSLCFSSGRGAAFQWLRGQVMEHACLAFLTKAITLASDINSRRVVQQAVQHGCGQDII